MVKASLFLTPDTPSAGTVTLCFTVPDDPDIWALILGACTELCIEQNWEEFGTMTPDEAVLLFSEVLNSHYIV